MQQLQQQLNDQQAVVAELKGDLKSARSDLRKAQSANEALHMQVQEQAQELQANALLLTQRNGEVAELKTVSTRFIRMCMHIVRQRHPACNARICRRSTSYARVRCPSPR